MSDIEGSTRLISTVGHAFPRLLDEHHTSMGAAIKAHEGTVVSTEGDSFFAVFPAARLARLEVWPGSGHFPHLAHPRRFAVLLAESGTWVDRKPVAPTPA